MLTIVSKPANGISSQDEALLFKFVRSIVAEFMILNFSLLNLKQILRQIILTTIYVLSTFGMSIKTRVKFMLHY